MTLITRRAALFGLIAAPAIVRASSLMAVVPVPARPEPPLYTLERVRGGGPVADWNAAVRDRLRFRSDMQLGIGVEVRITGTPCDGIYRVVGAVTDAETDAGWRS